jgi:signal transduction histidine kinase
MTKVIQTLSRWFRTLQAQLILWAILPVTLVVIALSLTGVYTHQQAMRDFVVERNRVVVRLLAHRLEDGLARGTIEPAADHLGAWLTQEVQDLPGTLVVLDTRQNTTLFPEQATAVKASAVVDALERGGNYLLDETEGSTMLITFAEVRGTDWIVVLQEPVDAIVGPILRFANLGPVVALVAAGLSVLILTFGWRTIVRPLQRLSHTASGISGPEDTSDIQKDIEGVTEIQELQRAMQAMIDRIQGYEAGVRDYLEAVTQGQEAERARVARDIHDGPVQGLIALSQRSEMLRRRIERGETEAAAEMLDALREAEVEIVEELRRIIGALRPVYLEDLGFQPALEMLVRKTDTRTEAEVRLEAPSHHRRLCPEVELAAYRIAQEALNNAVQHAEARHIVVRVAYAADQVELTLVDDGVGFELAERLDTYTRRGHFGLVGLQERVRQLNGSLEITTELGAGTTLKATLPATEDRGACRDA